MAWITEQTADAFLDPNPEWDALTNKGELLTLASNRLEQLTFKGEPIDRVEARYLDSESVTKEASSSDFLLNAQAGNFAYHAALGWVRTNADMEIVIENVQVAFAVPDNDNQIRTFTQALTLREIQSLHSFGGTFGGRILLPSVVGTFGMFSSIETQQANAIVDINGDQVFLDFPDRRINTAFQASNNVNVSLRAVEGTGPALAFDGVSTTDVIDEEGNEVTNTVPLILVDEYFTYNVKVLSANGLDGTMFLYVNDILVANPTFAPNTGAFGGKDGNRLVYTSGSVFGSSRVSYIELFGARVNTENPITIPIRLVGACALLASHYGIYPPNFVSDDSYTEGENENNYNRMQDLPINVQAAVEPFLAAYKSVTVDGVATTTERGKVGVDPTVVPTTLAKMTDLTYNNNEE